MSQRAQGLAECPQLSLRNEGVLGWPLMAACTIGWGGNLNQSPVGRNKVTPRNLEDLPAGVV